MKRSDFYFDLPEHLIAQHAPKQRGQSRLLDCEHQFKDRTFTEIGKLLKPNDCLVINNTKVIKATEVAKEIKSPKPSFFRPKVQPQ